MSLMLLVINFIVAIPIVLYSFNIISNLIFIFQFFSLFLYGIVISSVVVVETVLLNLVLFVNRLCLESSKKRLLKKLKSYTSLNKRDVSVQKNLELEKIDKSEQVITNEYGYNPNNISISDLESFDDYYIDTNVNNYAKIKVRKR